MTPNPYLVRYSQSEVLSLYNSGSISPNIDSNANLSVEYSDTSLYSSSITIPLQNFPVDSTKVETRYEVQFTEL
jgi:hypothetical protein